ncbi:type II toxin-antitoxin system VapC family toxin [Mycobacterium simiae]|uniref:Ribonuclease VapC n=1 Tax=Mycobacterium simiae TaxID=1784 RepID=A0A5B1BRJ7_MYCSI|nr:type II toxin-antitoxin system VapC family toxin [Mycobacterium simiae]KAA1250395.1 type II toxin-antitoxin system VapC family toxin [Mycobacterium simiae]
MILLDTNVLSALMRQGRPDPAVVTWLDEQPAESIWTTSITVFEIRTGIELLELGRPRRQLNQLFTQILAEELNGRIQAFDRTSALEAGTIAAQRKQSGQTVATRDVQIAGIAASRRAALATRNIRLFEGMGVDLVNPWA